MAKKTYYINYTDGLNKPSFNIPFGEVDNSTSLVLYGQGRTEYAEGLWNNLLHLLENFSNGNPNYTGPDNPTEGQLWYDSFNKVLKIYKKVNKSPLSLEIATPSNTNVSVKDEYRWVDIIDMEYMQNVFGMDGIDGVIGKIAALVKNNTDLLNALKTYYLPYSGGQLSGQLYLSNDPYVEYNYIPELYEAFSVGYLKSYLDNFSKTYKPEEGYFDIFGNSSRVDDAVGTYVPLYLNNTKTIYGSKLTFENHVDFTNSIIVNSAVDDTDLVKRIDFDNSITPDAIVNKIKDNADFKKLVTDAFTSELSKPENTTVVLSQTPAVLSSYCVVNSNPLSGNDTTPYAVLSQKVTSKTINSKFLITISLILSNGSKTGQAIGGLYKNDVALVEKFTTIEKTDNDAFSTFYTYIDSPTNTNETTYSVKVNGTKSGTDIWLLNQSANKKNFATSTMTILEFNQVEQPSISWEVLVDFNEVIINNGDFSGRIKISCQNCTIDNSFNFAANTGNIFTIDAIGNYVVSNISAIKQNNTDTEITFDVSGNLSPSNEDVIGAFTVNKNIFIKPVQYNDILNIFKHINIHCIPTITTTTSTLVPTTSTTTTLAPNQTTTTLAPTTTTTRLTSTTSTTTTLAPNQTTTTLAPTTTTTATPSLTVGAEYKGGLYIGDITDDGVKYKLILSPKSTERNYKYLSDRGSSSGNRTNNTPSRTNGPGNTTILAQTELLGFQAAWYCSQININGYNDWYLPSVDELLVMSVNRRALIAGPNAREWFQAYTGSPTTYSGRFYWSSTDNGNVNKAFSVDCIRFDTSEVAEVKETVLHVRAIRREPY